MSHPLSSSLACATASLSLAFVLAGCAVGPDHKSPEAGAPADWSAWHGGSPALLGAERQGSPASGIASGDWKAFGDPVLDRLEAMVLAGNPDLQTAALRFAQSRVQRTTTAAQQGPQLNASAGVTRQRQSETGAATRMIDALGSSVSNRDQLIRTLSEPYNLYQAGFDASWEIDLWGRVRRAIEAADADASASALLLRQARLSVQAELARNYFELRGTQRELRIARADNAAAAESLELVQARADGGLVTDLDPARQRALLADLRARIPALLQQEADAMNRITLLAGAPPGTLNAELADIATGDAADAPALPALALGQPAELARRRPDIAAAEAQLHAATARIGVAVADLYPRVTLGAGFGYESVGSSRFGDWGSRQWQIGPSISLPIFDGGRRRGTVELRELQQQEAAVAFQQTVLKAWHEIDSALTAYAAERQRQAELAERERRSRDALVLAAARYKGGLTDFGVELDARRTLLQARRDQAQSTSRLAVNLVAVYKALGGEAVAPEAQMQHN
ncbi:MULTISPECIES: efflux transporter outer membrane subunit [unclassified Variovorax]|jgi:NodT family efflux transporter outer membrane factor (OMF) lipoprotein|uniref:efflux transporter outer membrane subunit n=1 Tax=unclassified Variovorax TaxID=663243 RepID=UPI000F7EC7DE|nr:MULTISPECIES: efflux transporter outer membrane subunit [unclassified Variovorax]RSZ34415.1 efflux transporter outer membrane subunit [Variovorax sp. 553]RSZ34912.1 efflux transporter outer membrane subunit [Variovorax sp. 679]